MQLNTLPAILLLGVSILSPSLAIPTDQQVLSPSTKLITSSHHSKLDKVRHAYAPPLPSLPLPLPLPLPPQLTIPSLKKASIIPDIVDDFTPKCFVLPTYGHGKHSESVSPGKKLKISKTKKKPSLKVYCPDMKQTTGLTIALTDPDAPSNKDPKWSEMCHWIAPVAEALGPREGGGFEVEVEVEVEVDDIVKCKSLPHF
jgi:hypothetical protein